MKTEAKNIKTASAKPKSNLKLAIGKYKGVIVEKADCWDGDLKRQFLIDMSNLR